MVRRIKDWMLLRDVGSRISILLLIASFLPVIVLMAMTYGIVTDQSQDRDLFNSYVKVALFCVLLVVLLSAYYIRRMVGPLNIVIQGARRIAQGDYSPIDMPNGKEFRELASAINSMSSRIGAQIRTLQEHEERFRYQARFDSLTSLTNRRSLFAMLDALGKESVAPCVTAVMLIDVDRFNFFNSTLGHRAGDALLRLIARRLEKLIDKDDTVARLSGDEFVVVLRHCVDRDGIRQTVEHILHGMKMPFNIEGNDYLLTCTIGIAVYPEDASNPEMIVEAADMAVNEAKRSGRNHYLFFSPAMRETKLERLRLDTAIRQALERNELFLEYQPKVNARTGVVTGVEALLRWRYPKQGVVSPEKFVPLAEDIGLIVPIGRWVLQTACAQNTFWHAAGFTDLRVAVNLSAHQFAQPGLVEMVEGVLQETGLPAHFLELELTESAIMENLDRGIETLSKLSALGVRLAVDDFGTGYSSLYYLKRFPVHTVKIDRAFVRDLTAADEDRMIVQSIIGLAHNLKLQVVVEGVETEQQRDRLLASGSDEFQGELFSKPVPPEAISRLLVAQKRVCA